VVAGSQFEQDLGASHSHLAHQSGKSAIGRRGGRLVRLLLADWLAGIPGGGSLCHPQSKPAADWLAARSDYPQVVAALLAGCRQNRIAHSP